MDETITNDDKPWLFKPGNPGGGRTPMTEEEKAKKRALKKVVQSYIEDLTNSLPDIKAPLLKKAMEGDISAIKEVHDRIMGKPDQRSDVTVREQPIPLDSNVSQDNSIQPNKESEEKN